MLVITALSTSGWADDKAAVDDAKFFQEAVLPMLRGKCFSCHGPDEQKSSYRLDVREIALAGGDSGEPSIIPGKADASPLIRHVSDEDADLVMPPQDSDVPRLTAAEVASLRVWIDRGAAWPDSANATVEDPLDWWSFQSLQNPRLPADAANTTVRHGSHEANPIDQFVQAKLAQNSLSMSPPADARTLGRRLYFDLIGLPPEPEALDRFERAFAIHPDTAVNRLVDELLASPHYGERWARHWLDVVHYGDTHGYDKDKPRPNAWPYRDYVIRAFNQDKPYASFVEEQIAGDVLRPGTRDGVEALGFIAAGPWDLIGHAEVAETKTDGKIARHLDRDDMVANTIGTFCSVTVHCAQCHQHKFDPISQEDYYSLQAVFAALDRTDREYYTDEDTGRRFEQLENSRNDLVASLQQIEAPLRKSVGEEYVALTRRIEEASVPTKQQANQSIAPSSVAGGNHDQLVQEREMLLHDAADEATQTKRRELMTELARVEADIKKLPAPNKVYAGGIHSGSGKFHGTGANAGKPRPIFLLARGQVTQPGREVAPGALSAFSFQPARFLLAADANEGQRRAALAHWITDGANPLTWRSIVNRIWQYHFGRGIVDTPDDLGRNGGLPSHPELLDWLAIGFRDGGGSIKKLHRLIVTSATYRQSSASHADGERIDSSNSLLWRQNRRRLEAEAIRDSVLAVSGKLDKRMGGPGWQDFVIEHPEHSPHYEYALADPQDPSTWRRSIYRFIVRSQTQPWMTSLDCADPSMRVGKRNESLSAIQALAMLNNGFVLTQAKHFAERVERESSDLPSQVDRACRLALGDVPTGIDRQRLIEFARANGLPYLCRVLLNLNAFTFVD